jgi:hypothetical protein
MIGAGLRGRCGTPTFKTAIKIGYFQSVVDFVTAEAPNFNKIQQSSTSEPQTIQQDRFETWSA